MVDFNLDWPQLEDQLKRLFAQCINDKRCIPLPLEAGAEPAIMLMNALKCQLCDAPCCRIPGTNKPDQAFVAVSEPEKRALIQAGVPRRAIKSAARNGQAYSYMEYPCPLLKGNRCLAYEVRPIACQRYPIQVNFAVDGSPPALALDSGCVQAPVVAMEVYHRLHEAKRAGRI